MWRRNTLRAVLTPLAPLALALLVAACNNDDDAAGVTPSVVSAQAFQHGPNVIYTQRDFLGNPLVSEVTIAKAHHARYNKLSPFLLSADFKAETEAFVTGVAGRPQSVATTLTSVLYPDILVVQTDKSPATAGWLSWALANGWGGRKLTDDVVDAGLQAIFGPLLSPVNVSPGLASDNVSANDKPFLTTFPYYAPPTL